MLRADARLNKDPPDQVADDLLALIGGGHSAVVVECSGLDFVSTVGLSLLIRIHKRARQEGGELHISGLRPLIVELLEITRIDKMLTVHDDEESAVAAAGA